MHLLEGEKARGGSPRPEGPSLVLPEKGRGPEQRACLPERDTCKVAGGMEDLAAVCWKGWGRGQEPSWLPLPHPTSIPPLSPEIRMSKPLEAEKQGLDSPSEHTGVWDRSREAEGGQGAGVVGSYRGGW